MQILAHGASNIWDGGMSVNIIISAISKLFEAISLIYFQRHLDLASLTRYR